MLRNRTLLCKHSGAVVGLKSLRDARQSSYDVNAKAISFRRKSCVSVTTTWRTCGYTVARKLNRNRREKRHAVGVAVQFSPARCLVHSLPEPLGPNTNSQLTQALLCGRAVHPVHSKTSSDHRAVRVILRMMQKIRTI